MKKASDALQRIRGGEDFAKVAKSSLKTPDLQIPAGTWIISKKASWIRPSMK